MNKQDRHIVFERCERWICLREVAEKVVPVLVPLGVKRIAIFGSFARREETQESDIDILVEFEEPRKQPLGLLTWVRLERELSERLGRKVDLVSYSGLRASLRAQIEAEMVAIYEK